MKDLLLRLLILIGLCGAVCTVIAQGDQVRQVTDSARQHRRKAVQPKERSWHISDYISVGGYINTQYEYARQDLGALGVSESSVIQVRRARLDLKGDITPKIAFRLHGELANSPKLVDAYVRLKICRYFNLQVGQFKIPFSLENPYGPLDLEFADNAQVITALSGYSDVSGVSSFAFGREIGAMADGTLLRFERDGEQYPMLSYAVGVFGGNGINVKKDNMAKDVAGRLDFHPFLKNLVLSGSAYWGRYALTPDMDGLRLRCAGGAEYKDERLTVRGEYVWGKTDLLSPDAADQPVAQRLATQGFYMTAGYWFRFGWGGNSTMQQKLRPVLRYDYYERDLADNSCGSSYYGAGLDWWPERHLQFRIQYTLKQKRNDPHLGHSLLAMLSVKF